MALIQLTIPLEDTIDQWEQLVVLDDREFRLTFEWSTREIIWYLTIADQDGTVLVAGYPLAEAVNVLRRETDPRLPQGVLTLLDNTGARAESTRDGLGVGWSLLYNEAT